MQPSVNMPRTVYGRKLLAGTAATLRVALAVLFSACAMLACNRMCEREVIDSQEITGTVTASAAYDDTPAGFRVMSMTDSSITLAVVIRLRRPTIDQATAFDLKLTVNRDGSAQACVDVGTCSALGGTVDFARFTAHDLDITVAVSGDGEAGPMAVDIHFVKKSHDEESACDTSHGLTG